MNYTVGGARERWFSEQLNSSEVPDSEKGKPLKIPSRNFKIPLRDSIQARLGPPCFVVRARRIEEAIQKLMADLEKEKLF